MLKGNSHPHTYTDLCIQFVYTCLEHLVTYLRIVTLQ